MQRSDGDHPITHVSVCGLRGEIRSRRDRGSAHLTYPGSPLLHSSDQTSLITNPTCIGTVQYCAVQAYPWPTHTYYIPTVLDGLTPIPGPVSEASHASPPRLFLSLAPDSLHHSSTASTSSCRRWMTIPAHLCPEQYLYAHCTRGGRLSLPASERRRLADTPQHLMREYLLRHHCQHITTPNTSTLRLRNFP
jgi:hypothetical protein